MGSFYCEICGAVCSDTEVGYATGCEHYPADANAIEFWDVDEFGDVDEFQEQQDFAQDGEFENLSAEEIL